MKKYIYTFIAVFVLYLIGDSIYKQMNKEEVPGKAKRLACQKEVTTFERSYGNKDIKDAQKVFESGNITIKSDIEKSTYMDSTLFEYVDMKQLDKSVSDIVQSFVKSKSINDKNIIISYKVYENDIDDPKKKGDKCKLFRGYVVMKFKNNNNKTVYQIQIDFMDHKGVDIQKRIKCGVESFITYNK